MVVKNYYLLVGEKSEKERLMKSCNQFFSPDDRVYDGTATIGGGERITGSGELLDTTCSDLLREFTSFALGLFFNTERRWFTIDAPGYSANHEINKLLQKQSEILYKCIAKTNYYSESVLYEWDILCHGHGTMSIQQDDKTFAVCRTKDPVGTYYVQDVNGEVIQTYWVEEWNVYDVVKRFPDIEQKLRRYVSFSSDYLGDVSRKISIVSMYARVDTLPDKHLYEGYKWVRKFGVLLDSFERVTGLKSMTNDNRGFDLDDFDGFKEQTLFPTRDKATRKHPYGEGVAKLVLPKSRILNNLMLKMLQRTKYDLNPAVMMNADLAKRMGLISKAFLKVGKFLNRYILNPGSVYIFDKTDFNDGQPPITPINLGGDLKGVFTIYQALREQVGEFLPIPGQIYKVARQSIGELQQRSQQQAKRLGSIRAQYVREGLSKHLKRFYSLAKKAGKFNDVRLSSEIERDMEFVFDAFLLQANNLSDAYSFVQALGIAAQAMQVQPTMADWLDGDVTMPDIFKRFGQSGKLKSFERVQQVRQQRMQAVESRDSLNRQEQDNKTLASSANALDAFVKMEKGRE